MENSEHILNDFTQTYEATSATCYFCEKEASEKNTNFYDYLYKTRIVEDEKGKNVEQIQRLRIEIPRCFNCQDKHAHTDYAGIFAGFFAGLILMFLIYFLELSLIYYFLGSFLFMVLFIIIRFFVKRYFEKNDTIPSAAHGFVAQAIVKKSLAEGWRLKE